MTDNQLIMPPWVEQAMINTPDSDTELMLLRHFFDCWESLHAIPKIKANRKQQEEAAQLLVDSAHAVRKYRTPQ